MSAGPDVVIVGAGAAGLVAAGDLRAAGRSALVIEARGRIGGRTVTETASLGVPFDHGASWIHLEKLNPWSGIARAVGARTAVDRRRRRVYVGGRPADPHELEAFHAARRRTFAAVHAAKDSGADVAASTVIDGIGRSDDPWAAHAAAAVGPWLWGFDNDRLSTAGFDGGSEAPDDLLLPDGYGTLVARFAAGAPVVTDCPALRVAWRTDGVAVETPRGTIRAAAAILTVPASLLAAGTIRFDPPLDDERLGALEGHPLGLLGKVGLRFAGDPFGLEATTYVHERSAGPDGALFVVRPGGADYVLALYGGSRARALEAEGERAQVAAALDALAGVFGGGIRPAFRAGVATRWGADPLARGSYSQALPGKAHLRPHLARPHAGRVLFAGEATALDGWSATVAGAYLTGRRAAAEALALLGGA